MTRFGYDDGGTRVSERRPGGLVTWTVADDGLPIARVERSALGERTSRFTYDQHRHLVATEVASNGTTVRVTSDLDETSLGRWMVIAPWCERAR